MTNEAHPFTDSELTPAELQWQEDGAPFSSRYGDVYFSRSGGLDETHHVFLDANALQQRWLELDAEENPGVFTIGELGFGTGLNFLACWQLWQQTGCKRLRLHFISCEKHPLTHEALVRALQQWPMLKDYSQHLVRHYPPAIAGYHRLLLNTEAGDCPVTLDLYYGDALEMLQQQSSSMARIDTWFLDGFSPGLNPDLWSEPLLDTIAALSHQGTTLSSYSVTGRVVRYLKSLGFNVEKRQGFGSKRHMLFASFAAGAVKPTAPATAIVIGAGLAGATVARALAVRGVKVQVLEQAEQAAAGASGNRQAVVQLRLNKQVDTAWAFNLHSYLYALRFYSQLKQQKPGFEWHDCGVLTLTSAYTNTRDLSAAAEDESGAAVSAWQHYPAEVLQAVDKNRIHEITGMDINDAGLWQPSGGWLDPAQCTRLCLDHANISLQCSTRVTALHHDGHVWRVQTEKRLADGSTADGNELSAETVVVATSYQVRELEQTEIYPVTPLRGQVSHIQQTDSSVALKQVICSQRYIAPANSEGLHCAGASYVKNSTNTALSVEEHQENLEKLGELSTLLGVAAQTELAGRAGIRGASQDYLPIAGPVADPIQADAEYGGARHLSQTSDAETIRVLPGLFVSTGHGSHGTASCPVLAEHIAAQICHETSPLPLPQAELVNPARFVKRLRRRMQAQR
ncbi:MAG TPA: bifunctional tRNA (5-methylaminomethyl-2-thiouridine)(34)-methyltransferase MnmD/FAD-dependent 5-carboxymethylaminomethyl-2-thiouridine(34) oxidoreductase MnmC [Pseudohongiella sp.]|nr:bifunctional tRNA (5-methylaminomethyl-2-thiouridine)(34)-methyltransferase MnmD/FAD-dependent 5-carboxymethylaminomethyl-2-thiouridine(34) oxidoreductase MnmC [Pseudohongiella sp.]